MTNPERERGGKPVDVVDQRLREMAALSAAAPPWPPLVDMSEAAVTSRLRECAEISALALELARAGASQDGGGTGPPR